MAQLFASAIDQDACSVECLHPDAIAPLLGRTLGPDGARRVADVFSVLADPTRTRKLLMHREEINRLVGKVERAGYTLAPLDLHYKAGRIKLEVGLAKGKKQHDKRATIREREWGREQQRLLRQRPGSTRAG